MFQTLLLLPATEDEKSHVDITVSDILGPMLRTESSDAKDKHGILERDANLSLLSYAFNLNPALRHQLSGEIATFQTEADLRQGSRAAIEKTGVVKKGDMLDKSKEIVNYPCIWAVRHSEHSRARFLFERMHVHELKKPCGSS